MRVKSQSVTTNIVKVVLIAAALSAVAAVIGPKMGAAYASNANTDLGNISQVQQLSIQTDGLFAPSLESLTSSEFGMAVVPSTGSSLSYLTNAERTQYVAASKQQDGAITMKVATLDESSNPVVQSATCSEYAACIAQLPVDPMQRSAAPAWVNF